VEETSTFIATNADTGTRISFYKFTETYSGSKINTAWPNIKAEYDGVEGVIFNELTHTITYDELPNQSSLRLSDFLPVQINQNGTKLRFPADEEEGFPETIFTKQ